MKSFRDWIEHRAEEPLSAPNLALANARSGVAGVSRQGLERALGLSGDPLGAVLRALVTAGQVTVVLRNEERVYRVTM